MAEMPAGTMVAPTVFEPSLAREHGRGGRAAVVIPDGAVVEVADDSPPRADVVERAGADGGGGGAVLEETPREVVPEATPAAGPETATQGVSMSSLEVAM